MESKPPYPATITRGLRRGRKVNLVSWCNDWAQTDTDKVISLKSLEFGDMAVDAVLFHYQQDENDGVAKRLGLMFDLFDYEHFVETGRFKKK
jgi:hypothetical protein